MGETVVYEIKIICFSVYIKLNMCDTGGKCEGGNARPCRKCKRDAANKMSKLIAKQSRVPTNKHNIRRPGVNVRGKNVRY